MFTERRATMADLPALGALMDAAIDQLLGAYLSPEQTEASHQVMGLDTQLIEDGTYFVVEVDGQTAGCGGWSRRATLYGSDHTAGRDAALLDPVRNPARVRAMYTHPDFARRGVGRRILELCQRDATAAGFRRLELMATLAGRPLYSAFGFEPIEELVDTSTGTEIPLVRMGMSITAPEHAGSARAGS